MATQDLDRRVDWCITSGEPGAAELGLRLGAALWFFWDVRGHAEEGRVRMRDLLGLPGAQGRTLARARALQAAAWVSYVQETTADGVAALEESIALARELGDRVTLARSLAILGVTFGLNTAEPERAGPFLEEALHLGWLLEDTWSIGFSLFTLGRMALGRGDVPLAERYLQECLAVSERTHNTWGVACTLYMLGLAALVSGDLARAVRLQQESIEHNQALGNTRGMALCVEMLAVVATKEQQVERAARLFAIAEALCDAANYHLPPRRGRLP